jgi:hypothetical protein
VVDPSEVDSAGVKKQRQPKHLLQIKNHLLSPPRSNCHNKPTTHRTAFDLAGKSYVAFKKTQTLPRRSVLSGRWRSYNTHDSGLSATIIRWLHTTAILLLRRMGGGAPLAEGHYDHLVTTNGGWRSSGCKPPRPVCYNKRFRRCVFHRCQRSRDSLLKVLTTI